MPANGNCNKVYTAFNINRLKKKYLSIYVETHCSNHPVANINGTNHKESYKCSPVEKQNILVL